MNGLSDFSEAKPFVEGAGGKGPEGTRNLREDCVATLTGRGHVVPICAGVGLPRFGAGAGLPHGLVLVHFPALSVWACLRLHRPEIHPGSRASVQ